MSVARITEIKSSSRESFGDAVRQGVKRAEKTLQHVRSAWIQDQEVILNDAGDIAEYRVHMKVTFMLNE